MLLDSGMIVKYNSEEEKPRVQWSLHYDMNMLLKDFSLYMYNTRITIIWWDLLLYN